MSRAALALLAGSFALAPLGGAACAKAKSHTEKVAATGKSESLAADDRTIYWLSFEPAASKLHVEAYTKQNGARRRLASVPAAHEWLSDELAVDDKNLYFFARDAKQETLWAVPKAGGAPVPLAPAQHDASGSVASDGARVYWLADGEVRAVPIQGGATIVLATGQTGARDVVVDAASVYWDHGFDISSMPTSGGAPAALTRIGGRVLRLVADSASLYFGTMGGPSDPAVLCWIDKAGGPVRILWTGPWIGAFAVGDGSVYFDYRSPDAELANHEHIGRVPVNGGPVTVLDEVEVGQSLQQMTIDKDEIYGIVGPGSANTLERLPKRR